MLARYFKKINRERIFMKYAIKLLMMSLVLYGQILGAQPPLMLQGCIYVEGNENSKVPELTLIFNGMHTTTKNGFFSIRVHDRSVENYKLVICKALQQNFEQANTLKEVALPANRRCEIISLVCKKEDSSLQCSSQDCEEAADGVLTCKARDLPEGQKIDEENTIIVCIDPKYVERLEPWNIKLAENFIKLPRIVLKKNTDKELAQISAKSLLYSLDAQTFHEPIERKTQVIENGKVVLSLVQ